MPHCWLLRAPGVPSQRAVSGLSTGLDAARSCAFTASRTRRRAVVQTLTRTRGGPPHAFAHRTSSTRTSTARARPRCSRTYCPNPTMTNCTHGRAAARANTSLARSSNGQGAPNHSTWAVAWTCLVLGPMLTELLQRLHMSATLRTQTPVVRTRSKATEMRTCALHHFEYSYTQRRKKRQRVIESLCAWPAHACAYRVV